MASRHTPKSTIPGFGKRIAEARKSAGYSQKALMDALGWPSDSNSRMSGYENEEREPSLGDFERIADLCKTDPAWLAFAQPKRRKVAS